VKPSETARLLARLADIYDKPIAEGMLRGYHAALKDLPFSHALEAVDRVIATSEFFPRPAAIRKAAGEIADACHEADSATAWEAVLKAVRRWGRHRETQALASLPDRAARAASAVGWEAICNSTLIAAERKAFLAAYEAMQRDGVRRVQLPPGQGPGAVGAITERLAGALKSGDDK
jgi:hypothetical protein